MERLTKRDDNGHVYYPHCNKVKGCGGYCATCNFNTKISDKLAEYEDIEEQLNEIGVDLGADMADIKKAIEKQTPKKPIEINGDCYEKSESLEVCECILKCPSCDSDKLKPHYPCKCGQMLDWSAIGY